MSKKRPCVDVAGVDLSLDEMVTVDVDVSSPITPAVSDQVTTDELPVKRKPGRPRKVKPVSPVARVESDVDDQRSDQEIAAKPSTVSTPAVVKVSDASPGSVSPVEPSRSMAPAFRRLVRS